jgi:hypothetical protein
VGRTGVGGRGLRRLLINAVTGEVDFQVTGNATYQEFVDPIGSEIACTALAQLITVLGEFGLSFVGDGSVRVIL